MKSTPKYKVTITDFYNEIIKISFTKHQYPNLMTLIADNYPEKFGECKGRGWCGTCHIKVTSGTLSTPIEITEKQTLKTIYNADISSRLACQIMLNEKINNMTFKIINN